MDLAEVARDAGRSFGRLCPNGGCRWTREDRDAAVSILYEVTCSDPYRRAIEGGMTAGACRAYLVKALRNRLLKAAMRDGRVGSAGEGMDEAPARPPMALDCEDACILSERAWGALSPLHRDELTERILGCQVRGYSPSSRMRDYRWAYVKRVLARLVRDADLTQDEGRSVLDALIPRLKEWQAGRRGFRDSIA